VVDANAAEGVTWIHSYATGDRSRTYCTIQGFDVTRPHTLVYERHGKSWQLGALEWAFRAKPSTPPLPGATYGSSVAR
jgi:hypothetical protein